MNMTKMINLVWGGFSELIVESYPTRTRVMVSAWLKGT